MRRAAVAALAGVAVLAGCTSGSAQVPAPAPEGQAADLCRTLVAKAPDTMFGQDRISVEPASDYVAAWGDPPIALRCGVERPERLRPDSELLVVNDIAWFAQPPDNPNLYTAVGREAYVELSISPSYGAPAEGLVAISDLITEEIPALPSGEL